MLASLAGLRGAVRGVRSRFLLLAPRTSNLTPAPGGRNV